MSNKKKTFKRQIKRPARYNDHVVGNMSKNRDDVTSGEVSDGSNNDASGGINFEAEMSNVCREKVRIDGELGDNEGIMNGNDDTGGKEISREDVGVKKVDNVKGKEVQVEIHDEVGVNTASISQEMSSKESGNKGKGSDDASKSTTTPVTHTVSNTKLSNTVNNGTIDDNCPTTTPNVNELPVVNKEVSGTTGHSVEVNENANDKKMPNDSYVNKVKMDEMPKKLNYIPTILNETGIEVVVFDDMLVKKGSERWNLTVSGYFVGYKMAPYDLRYNIRRMWSKYGVKDIIVNSNGTYLFKFGSIEGLEAVISKGPWMVNNKPLIVQRWNPELGMQMIEHNKLPVWVRLNNIPLEAWSVDGISALASSLGNPMIMDSMTATMCHKGFGTVAKLGNFLWGGGI